MSDIQSHQYDNGLTLIVEPMTGVQSVSMDLLLGAGAAAEPGDQLGVAAVLSDMIFRGAGDLDARAHSEALDRLGVHRDSSVDPQHLSLSATMLGPNLDDALPLLLDVVRAPRLADESFEPARQLAIQAIDGLDDEPQQKLLIELKRRHLGLPLGRSTCGEREHLTALTAEQVRAFWREAFGPSGAILAFAGHLEFERIRDRVGEVLGEMSGGEAPGDLAPEPEPGKYHVKADSVQQHIGVAYDTVGQADPENMTQRVAVAALSGGMSGRLFTEVREKRGLCYAVMARYSGFRRHGHVLAYAGTTTERAGETLDLLTAELKRIGEGAEEDEHQRAVVGLKARLVMQGESTGARASALARDQWLLGRPRTLDEVAAEVDAVTLDQLNTFLDSHRPDVFTIVNIGPEPL